MDKHLPQVSVSYLFNSYHHRKSSRLLSMLPLLLCLLLLGTEKACGQIIWDFSNNTVTTFTNGQSYSFIANDGTTEMRYSAGSSDQLTTTYLKENGKTGSGTVYDIDGTTNVKKNRLIRLFISGSGTLKIECLSSNVGIYVLKNGSTDGTTLISSYTANTTTSEITVTTSPLWIETSTKGYITKITWTPSASCTAPFIDTQPSATTICSGSSASLSIAASSNESGTLSYQWYSNSDNSNSGGVAVSGATSATVSVSPASNTYYYCVVTDDQCTTTTTSNAVLVTVNAATAIDAQPSSVSNVMVGTATTLTVAATGTNLTYQWYTCDSDGSNASAISGETSATLSVTPSVAGTIYYKCIVSSICGNVTCNVVSITATAGCAAGIPTIADVTNECAGTGLTFSKSGTPASGDTWYWQTSASGTSTTNNATSDYTTATTAGSYTMYLRAYNSSDDCWGTAVSKTGIVYSSPSVSTTTSVSTTVGTATTLTATATGGELTYQWYSNTSASNSSGTLLTEETASTYTFTPASAGSTYYYCVVTNACGNATTDAITVTATASAASSLVCGYTDDYIWKSGSGYTGCVGTPSGNTNATSSTKSMTYSTYAITGMTNLANGRIGDNTEVEITFTANSGYYISSVCTYGKLEETTGGYYSWNGGSTWTAQAAYGEGKKEFIPSDTTHTVFKFKFTSASSNSGGLWWRNAQISVCEKVCTPPTVTASADQTVCSGSAPTQMSVSATAANSGGTFTYQWYKGNSIISGATSSTYTESGSLTATTKYYCYVTENSSCTGVDSVTVTVLSAPSFSIQTPVDAVYEQNEPADSLFISTSNVTSYQWFKNTTKSKTGGTSIDGATLTYYKPSTATIGTLYYYCVVKNGTCFSDTSDIATVQTTAIRNTPAFTWLPTNNTSLNAGGIYSVSVTCTSNGTLSNAMTAATGLSFTGGTSGTLTILGTTTATEVVFVASVPETATYRAGTDTCRLPITTCAATYLIPVTSASTDGTSSAKPRYYWSTDYGKFTRAYGTSGTSGASTTCSSLDGESFSYQSSSSANTWSFVPLISNVTKVRVYLYNKQNSALTVSAVYTSTAYFSTTGNATNVTATSTITYSDGEGVNSGSCGYFDIIFPTALSANSMCYFTTSVNTVPLGIKLYAGGNAFENTTLAWSGGLADNANLGNIAYGSPDFTYTASQTQENKSAGAITYESTNTTIATVDASTGKVSVLEAGTNTIRAILAPSGCYKGDTITYRFTVLPCAETAASISNSGNDTICSGSSITLTLTGGESGATIQWYNDSTALTGKTSSTLTVTAAGNYYATTTKTCTKRTNTITVSVLPAPKVTALHEKWYVKDSVEILLPIELFDVANLIDVEGLSNVGWSVSASGLGSDIIFTMDENSIVSMSGTPKAAATTHDTIQVILTATNDCGATAKDTVDIIVRPYSATPSLAFIVTGTKGGAFSAYTSAECDGTNLVTYLEANGYDVQGVNAYATTNKDALLEYYSQFDIVILTDWPDTNTKDANNFSYSNAIGYLIDYIPLLTMEAYVSQLSVWNTKGIDSSPKSPSSNAHDMTVLCYAHDMFEGTGVSSNTDDRVINMITSGTMQGFTPIDVPNFIYIGTIDGGTYGTLITCCERQAVVPARMMMLGLQHGSMEYITNYGKKTIKQMLDYLLIKDPVKVADCSVVFTNKTGDGKWSSIGNWYPAYNALPSIYQGVRIERPCNVDITTAVASSIKLREDSVNDCIDCTGDRAGIKSAGTLTILPTGGLTVGMIRRVKGAAFATLLPTEATDITIQATSSNNGALAFTDNDSVQAVVQYYSKGSGATFAENQDTITLTNVATWQFMGIPFKGFDQAVVPYRDAWMCRWTEGSTGLGASWDWVDSYDPLEPFEGYAITQAAAKTYTLTGTLNNGDDHTWSLTNSGTGIYPGFNLLANSWTAPIDISKLTSANFGNADNTIYIFNSGTYSQWDSGSSDATGASTIAGNYLAIPRGLSGVTGLKAIPPMQGFFLYTNTATSFTVPYTTAVYGTDYTLTTDPMRAPAARDEYVLSLYVQGKHYADKVALVSGNSDFTTEFDNGYDARKFFGLTAAPQLFVLTNDGYMAVDAVPSIDGRFLGFRAGEDTVYTMTFSTDKYGLYLHDLQTGAVTPIETNGTYTFTANNEDYVTRRFKISSLQTITEGDMEQLRVYVHNHILTVENYTNSEGDLQLYDIQGRCITTRQVTDTKLTIPLSFLPPGIYIARARTNTEVKSVKIIF